MNQPKLRVAIVGSRDWNDIESIRRYIESLPADTIVVSGGARGADSIAAELAQAKGLEVLIFEAQWDTYGKKAGMVRNADIVKNAHMVVAFWDGKSRGTKNTIELALQADNVKRITVVKL